MKKYNDDIKNKIIVDYKNGKKVTCLVDKYSIPRSTLYKILNDAKVIDRKNNVNSWDYSNLKTQYDRKCKELEIFKKLRCFPDAKVNEKEEAIYKYKDIYPIKTMCRLLEIPKGTVYNYIKHHDDITLNDKRNEMLSELVLDLYKKSKARFGAKKILAVLRLKGYNTTLGKVQELMKNMNLKSKYKMRKPEIIDDSNSKYCVNRVKQNFNPNVPNKLWVGDVTELKIKGNKFYLCVILDLFSRKVIAYNVSYRNNTNLTVNTFKKAFECRKEPQGVTFHSDQGCNYTAFEFRSLLKLLNVNQSFSRKGVPQDNACVESFFSSYKREDYNSSNYNSYEEVKESVDDFMNYYNNLRPHKTLGYLSPNKYEEAYFNK